MGIKKVAQQVTAARGMGKAEALGALQRMRMGQPARIWPPWAGTGAGG